MQTSTPSKQATSSQNRNEASGELFLESGSGNFSPATTSGRQQLQRGSLEQQKRLTPLVRNTSDIAESPGLDRAAKSKRSPEEQRDRLVSAEFADDSIRSLTSVPHYQARRASSRSVSLSSLKEQYNCSHHQRHHHQEHYHKYQNDKQNATKLAQGFDETTILEGERLITSSNKTGCQSPGNCNLHDCCSCDANKEYNEKHKAKILEEMATNAQTTKLIPAYFAAELIGTFLIVLIGDGTIAAYILTKRQVDIFCACFAFGVGAMIATYVSAKISGAHLNPAATLALALDGRLKWILVPVYISAQYLGGFLAALVLFLNYSEAIASLDGGEHSAFGSSNSTGGIFSTYPASYVTVWGALMDQIVGTAVLLFSLSAIGDTSNRAADARLQPIVVAFVIGLICVAFSPNCGAIFNPARDLSPRLLTYAFGYPSVWEPIEGTYWVLAGVVGPHIGAIIGVFAYKYLIGSALRAYDRHAQLMVDLHNNGHLPSAGEKAPHSQRLTSIQHDQSQQSRCPELSYYGATH